MFRKAFILLLLALGPVLGFAVGRASAPTPSENESGAVRSALRRPDVAVPSAAAPAATYSGLTGADLLRLREEMRRAVRDECRLAAQQHAPEEAAAKPPEPKRGEEPTEDNLTAFDSGTRLVDTAVASHRWDEGNVLQLRALMRQMTPELRIQVLQRLTTAINRQELRTEPNGPPF